MIQKIRVQTIVGPDLKGNGVLYDIKKFLKLNAVEKVSAIKVYRLEGVSEKEARVLSEKLLSEKINQRYSINKDLEIAGIKVEIAYKPGVMNPEVASIEKASADLGINVVASDSSWEYVFFGKLNKNEAVAIINKIRLYNPLVEEIVEEEPRTLIIKGKPGKTSTIHLKGAGDDNLMELSKDKLFLNLDEMKAIQRYFQEIGRDPTDLELETIAQTWSEHSGHKTFKAELMVDGKKKEPLIQRIKKEALKHDKNIVSAFEDNSGVMDFYEGYGICGKVETHNAPSAIEPYGGAMTGSGGVFRDIAGTGKGAKNIASTDVFCVAPADLAPYDLPQGCLPPEYILKRVVAGVRDYGNRMGIPTNNGSVHFHPDFRARPTVIAGAFGIVPKKYALKESPKIGDLIICVGGRTGRDGIHGATFSSGEMTEKTTEVHSSAVQIGNAIEEKRMFDALLEARDNNLIRLIQDVGGGGFSSAIGEIGERLGVSVDLKKAFLKYQGLSPWEIWISESQERMIVVIERKSLEKFKKLCKKYNVEMTVLGEFDGRKKLTVKYGNRKVADLDMKFLHHGLPKKVMKTNTPSSVRHQRKEPIKPKNEKKWIDLVKKILRHGNVCSKEPIIRMYDHSVQGTNDLQPYSGENQNGPNDAPVIRPFLDRKYGMVISHGLNPVLNNIDPYWGSIWAAAEALSNFVAVGGDYKNASLINNYIWPFPDEQALWSLDRSVDAVVDFMKVLKTPVISGKDSLSSTYRSSDGTIIKIPPVLCISVLGKIEDTDRTVTSDFKKTGTTIILVGKIDNNLGGSVYYQVSYPEQAEKVEAPRVDLDVLPKTFDAIFKGIQNNKILSCHDISEGGLISALFEMSLGGGMGVSIEVGNDRSVISQLFNETAGCFMLEVEDALTAKKLFSNVPYIILGRTVKEEIIDIKNIFKVKISDLETVWQEPMRRLFE